jgi:hypothetical protein
MKRSNIFLGLAVLFLLASILAFDFGIKARYISGDFRNPNEEFTALDFKDFDTIYVNASSIANVNFAQGPFKVQVFQNRADIVKITQQGRSLAIDVSLQHTNYEDTPFTLFITCPKIARLIADNHYLQNGKLVTDTNARADFVYQNRMIDIYKKVEVEGFNQDSISIVQNNGSHVRLINNQFKGITGIIGSSTKSASFLTIEGNNVIDRAYLDIRNNSHLFMSKATIRDLGYKLAPDAKITFSGGSVGHFQ